MNEAVIRSGTPRNALGKQRAARKLPAALYGYFAVCAALFVGYSLRDSNWISPEDGAGYWLGIIGGSMMLLLLLYPLRKRIQALRVLGGTAKWFRMHMILGVLGPLLILYHSNFQMGSFNSRIALICMLLVAGSGVVGRYIYAGIHRGLYGNKTSVGELRQDLQQSLEHSHGLANLVPELVGKLEELATEVEGDTATGGMSVSHSISWSLRRYTVWFSLRRIARRELQARAAESAAVASDLARVQRSTSAYIRRFVGLAGRIAQFTLYERLFSLWHVLHMPLFLMMIISALVHVLAVHMY